MSFRMRVVACPGCWWSHSAAATSWLVPFPKWRSSEAIAHELSVRVQGTGAAARRLARRRNETPAAHLGRQERQVLCIFILVTLKQLRDLAWRTKQKSLECLCLCMRHAGRQLLPTTGDYCLHTNCMLCVVRSAGDEGQPGGVALHPLCTFALGSSLYTTRCFLLVLPMAAGCNRLLRAGLHPPWTCVECESVFRQFLRAASSWFSPSVCALPWSSGLLCWCSAYHFISGSVEKHTPLTHCQCDVGQALCPSKPMCKLLSLCRKSSVNRLHCLLACCHHCTEREPGMQGQGSASSATNSSAGKFR